MQEKPINIKGQIFRLGLLLSGIILIGTLGYFTIEGWNLSDSLFMTVITMSTVGYGAVDDLSQAGQFFTIFLNIGGIALYSTAFFKIVSIVSAGSIIEMMRRYKMDKKIDNLENHYIICGCGETVKHIANELFDVKREFVVVCPDEEEVERKNLKDYYHIVGEPDKENVLKKAGVERARGIFCVMPEDRENILVTLTARSLNQKLQITTSCVSEEARSKFQKAGADRIIFADRIGGLRMVSEMIRPDVVTFLDKMVRQSGGIRFEEIAVAENSQLIGQPMTCCAPDKDFQVTVVAVLNNEGKYEYNHLARDDERTIKAGEKLVVIGCSDEIEKMREYAS